MPAPNTPVSIATSISNVLFGGPHRRYTADPAELRAMHALLELSRSIRVAHCPEPKPVDLQHAVSPSTPPHEW